MTSEVLRGILLDAGAKIPSGTSLELPDVLFTEDNQQFSISDFSLSTSRGLIDATTYYDSFQKHVYGKPKTVVTMTISAADWNDMFAKTRASGFMWLDHTVAGYRVTGKLAVTSMSMDTSDYSVAVTAEAYEGLSVSPLQDNADPAREDVVRGIKLG